MCRGIVGLIFVRVSPKVRPDCDKLLGLIARYRKNKDSFQTKSAKDTSYNLLNTIKVPEGLIQLESQLPNSNYVQTEPNLKQPSPTPPQPRQTQPPSSPAQPQQPPAQPLSKAPQLQRYQLQPRNPKLPYNPKRAYNPPGYQISPNNPHKSKSIEVQRKRQPAVPSYRARSQKLVEEHKRAIDDYNRKIQDIIRNRRKGMGRGYGNGGYKAEGAVGGGGRQNRSLDYGEAGAAERGQRDLPRLRGGRVRLNRVNHRGRRREKSYVYKRPDWWG